MIRSKLTKVASWLWMYEPSNKTRLVIYDKMEKFGRHPSTIITVDFDEKHMEVINRVLKTMEQEEEKREKMLKRISKSWKKKK